MYVGIGGGDAGFRRRAERDDLDSSAQASDLRCVVDVIGKVDKSLDEVPFTAVIEARARIQNLGLLSLAGMLRPLVQLVT